MIVRIESLLSGAERATGAVVVIDVFRAFTNACLAFRRGAKQIVLFEHIERARAFAAKVRKSILMGEVHGKKPAGFHFGNSPAEIANVDFSGRTIVQSTRAGTTGVTRVKATDGVFVASLQNARATAEHLMRRGPEVVTLVAMGWEGKFRTEEDELCALYIRNIMEGSPLPHDAVREVIMASREAQKFGDPRTPHFDKGDLDHCLDIDVAHFAIRVKRERLGRWVAPVARPVRP